MREYTLLQYERYVLRFTHHASRITHQSWRRDRLMEWTAYFERNRASRLTIPWEREILVEPHLRAPLIRSLQRFQVGEQGDGLHLRAAAAATGDADYAYAIALFVAEEQEHARLLALL